MREKAAEEKRVLQLTHLCTPNSKHLSHVRGIPPSKPDKHFSYNITDMIFNTRLGQIQYPRTVQQKITESFFHGLHPCGSRKILERVEAIDAYCRLEHMSYMEPNKDQSKLLCLWSLKDIIGQRIQLLNVKSFTRCHEEDTNKIKIDVQLGDVVILQSSYKVTGLTWVPKFSGDNDQSDYILYTTTCFIGNNPSLAIVRRLDSSDERDFHCNEFNLGMKATWSCAWNRQTKQISIGCEKMALLVDVETRRMWKLHVDKSDVLSQVFSHQVTS